MTSRTKAALLVYLFLVFFLMLRLMNFVPQKLAVQRNTGRLKEKLLAVNSQLYSEPTASLVSGITVGGPSGLDRDSFTKLQNAGLTHVVVASGMNLVLLANFLALLKTKFPRPASKIMFYIVILLYVYLVGFDTAIVRAALMVLIASMSLELGRPIFGWWTILVTAYLFVIIDPGVLTDISFQLSFLATAGQIILGSFFQILPQWRRIVVGEVLQTIFAQAFTLPVLLSHFGIYPTISIVVNGLILWTVPLVMLLGLTATVGGFTSLVIGRILALPVLALTSYFWAVVDFVTSWKIALFAWHWDSWAISLAYYCFLSAFLIYVYNRLCQKQAKIFPP